MQHHVGVLLLLLNVVMGVWGNGGNIHSHLVEAEVVVEVGAGAVVAAVEVVAAAVLEACILLYLQKEIQIQTLPWHVLMQPCE